MTRVIKLKQYHNDPVAEIEMPDGSRWTVRQPLEADYFRMQDVIKAYQKKVTDYSKELAGRAEKATEEAGTDDAGRKLIEEEGDEDRIPIECTVRYLSAAIVAVFVEPKQTPEAILEALGPGVINEIRAELEEILDGEAAKKKIRGRTIL